MKLCKAPTMVGAFAVLAVCGLFAAANPQATNEEKTTVLRHVVLFQFKEETKPEKIDEVARAFAALPQKIDAIVDFEWGTDVSTENKSQGFTHCFIVTFQDEAGCKEYLPHPAHQEFVALVRPHLANVLVVDYHAQSEAK